MLVGVGQGVFRVASMLTRRHVIGAGILASLSPAVLWSESYANEASLNVEHEVQRLRIEGSPLEISVAGQPGVGEILTYAARRYFYEINSQLSQDDIVDISNIESYIALYGEFPLSYRIKQGVAILIDCNSYPMGSMETFGDIDSMVIADILESLGGKLYWGGDDVSNLISYLGVSENLPQAEIEDFRMKAENDSYLSDQGPGAEPDMFTT